MQITRETDYAIRCVYYLAGRRAEVIMTGDIAKSTIIPKSFLAKILQRLEKAKLVKSYRGVKGGFRLAKKPREINLFDVIKAIEGPIALNRCTSSKKRCASNNTCSVHPVWFELRQMVEKRLKKSDFASLIRSRGRS